jgi:VanZ family protein
MALGLSILYAITDEFHQGFVKGRSASPLDVLIDVSGSLACLLCLLLWFGIKQWESRLRASEDPKAL